MTDYGYMVTGVLRYGARVDWPEAHWTRVVLQQVDYILVEPHQRGFFFTWGELAYMNALTLPKLPTKGFAEFVCDSVRNPLQRHNFLVAGVKYWKMENPVVQPITEKMVLGAAISVLHPTLIMRTDPITTLQTMVPDAIPGLIEKARSLVNPTKESKVA